MMKLCFVSHSMDPGESGQSLARLCAGLAARGHYVTLITPGGPDADMRADEGVTQLAVPALRERFPQGLLRSSSGLSRMIRSIDPDVIACWTLHLLPTVSAARSLAC